MVSFEMNDLKMNRSYTVVASANSSPIDLERWERARGPGRINEPATSLATGEDGCGWPDTSGFREIGLGLTGFGIFFSFLGIIFFFDKGLIAMGNILFLSGLGLTIGLKSTMQFFTKPKNYKGTISFGAGFFLVLIGWPFFGMLLEAYGFIVLFSGFWPTLVVFLQRIPIIGWIFQQPFVTSFLDRYRGKRVPV
ncbi:vesicle transport protein GOT1-like isoform X1 [Panicum virgatum]|nr:vesicle transport protein GOT1-like isoform X1 [Panicum virgatum]XP_039827726.1 vesicle transport protein GOT1-like isoform X1 [Panicum virgatum]